MSTIYPLSTYSLATISNQVVASSSTPIIIWSASIPAGAKGRNAILQLFFNLFCASNFAAGQNFYYGLYVDGVPLAIGDSTTMKYVHTAANQYAISAAGVGLGTNPLFGYQPLVIPLAISPTASQIQIGITNSSLGMATGTSAQPHVTSNVLTSTGTVGSNNYYPQNTFMTPGLGNYTVPTTVYSVGGTSNNVVGVFMYCWGSGGYQLQASGAGGFTSGFYSCSGGTNLRYVVGVSDSGIDINTGGSGRGNGGGGGFSGVFLSNSGGVAQSNALIIAGAGGMNCYIPTLSASGNGGGGAYGSNAFGVGYSGGNPYVFGVGDHPTVTGGTLSAGGVGMNGKGGGPLIGGATTTTTGEGVGGGGGYYGGGGSTWNSGSNQGGGGGSSFAANAVVSPAFASATRITTAGMATSAIPPGGNTSPFYVLNASLYGYGGSNTPYTTNQGLVVIVPAIGSTAVQVGVSASLYAL